VLLVGAAAKAECRRGVGCSRARTAAPAAAPTPTSAPRARLLGPRKGTAIIIGGITLTTLGVVALGGTVSGLISTMGCKQSDNYYLGYRKCDEHEAFTQISAVSFVMLTSLGIPLIVIGVQENRARATVSSWVIPEAAGLRLNLSL
jgi:hypothetical protein